MRRSHLFAAALLCCSVLAAQTAMSQQATQGAPLGSEVKVVPDRSSVAQNETFTVQFIVESQQVGDPDWSPLERDFQIVSKNKSFRQSIVNGVSSAVHEWRVQLQPKRGGQLQIPVLQFGALRSRATPIQVKPPAQAKAGQLAEEFFIEVSAQPENPYVQEQVLFTLKVFMLHNLSGNVTPPQGDSNVLVESLGDARRFRVNRGGRNYQVYERRYLMYPQSSGALRIQPVVLSGDYVKRARRFSLRRESREVMLQVRQVPPSFPGKVWLPAERFNLKEDWSASLSSWRAGEPITRTLNLEATGLLAKQIPEVSLSVGEGFRFYTESADFKNERRDTTVIGKRQQSAVLIPVQAGTYTLPAVKVPWWNTRKDRLEFAELPARQVKITEAAFSSLTLSEPSATGSGADATDQESVTLESARDTTPLWFWISVALFILWLMTMALMWRGGGWYRLLRSAWSRRETLRNKRRHLHQACRANDAAAAKDTLLQWAQAVWVEDPPTSLRQIGERYSSSGGVAMRQQILNLERALYTRRGSWQGHLLWDVFNSQTTDNIGKEHQPTDTLEPLHRL